MHRGWRRCRCASGPHVQEYAPVRFSLRLASHAPRPPAKGHLRRGGGCGPGPGPGRDLTRCRDRGRDPDPNRILLGIPDRASGRGRGHVRGRVLGRGRGRVRGRVDFREEISLCLGGRPRGFGLQRAAW